MQKFIKTLGAATVAIAISTAANAAQQAVNQGQAFQWDSEQTFDNVLPGLRQALEQSHNEVAQAEQAKQEATAKLEQLNQDKIT